MLSSPDDPGERPGTYTDVATCPDLDPARARSAETSTIAPQIGDRIDHQYEIRGLLGSGGMGTVYLAHDQRLDRDVAIKLIHSDMLSRARIDGFQAEARAMARVRHPNVVTIYAFGDRRGHPYFVMEYVHGDNLATWRRRHPLLAPAEALEVIDALAQGVQAIHDTGAVHRDLKPGNVLMGAQGRVAVTDFGLALGPDRIGERMPLSGTPAYIAPEIARGDVLDPRLVTRLDIYALGVIAFELLTGELPFKAPRVTDLLDLHAHAEPPRPSTVRSRLSPSFDLPILQAMAKDPALRPASAEDLRDALRRAFSATSPSSAPALRVMVVDDEVNTLVATRQLLVMTFPGVEVVTVADAASAQSIAERETFDLIVTDLDMPHGGGAALTAALRANPRTAQTPIVVMTAYGGAADWQVLRQMGADRFLVKPVELDMLTSVVRSLTGRTDR